MFQPSIEREGDQARVRVAFLDGTRATVTYPQDLRLTQDGAKPYTTGGEPGGQVTPQISYGGVYFRLHGGPLRCVETRDGSLAGIWQHPDGDVLVFRFGNSFVSVFESHTDLEVWAQHLRGRITRGGWLVLKGDDRLKVGPEQEYGDTSIMLGSVSSRAVILWPLRCGRTEKTVEDVVSGRGIDGLDGRGAFASWCDREASMEVHVYASADFIKRVAAGLHIDDVRRAHPLSRYHIVP